MHEKRQPVNEKQLQITIRNKKIFSENLIQEKKRKKYVFLSSFIKTI